MNDVKDLKIDLSLVPSTLDVVHVGLAAAVVALLLLSVTLLLIMAISLSRKLKKPSVAAVQPEPQRIVVMEEAPPPAPEPLVLKEAIPDAALQLLGLLQQEARFIDFVQENVAPFSDAEIGAAARVVHEGCAKVIKEHFTLEPVMKEAENSRVTLQKGFDASAVRLTGNLVGEAPFTGNLVHKGWRVTHVKLPKIAKGHSVNVVAAAEVEL
ncbi:MAG: DUF2760 domain-containing protein [Pseudomonadota bacterium]